MDLSTLRRNRRRKMLILRTDTLKRMKNTCATNYEDQLKITSGKATDLVCQG
ncbi:hypothetical protein MKW92_053968 [Papaver armeniacum]|nr:hypothetical protein MKW92_053968 [Papaver armeniacum]